MKAILNSLLSIIRSIFKLKEKTLRIQFKTPRIKNEWAQLVAKNIHLSVILVEIASFTWRKFEKEIVLTNIFRTLEESKQTNNPQSVHRFWRGVDIRSSNFTRNEIEQIVEFVNSNYIYDLFRPNKVVAIYHNVGFGCHFHIQNHPNTKRRANNG